MSDTVKISKEHMRILVLQAQTEGFGYERGDIIQKFMIPYTPLGFRRDPFSSTDTGMPDEQLIIESTVENEKVISVTARMNDKDKIDHPVEFEEEPIALMQALYDGALNG